MAEVAAVSETALPSPALIERFFPEQRGSFLRAWDRLPVNLRGIAFELRSPEWIPVAIERLGDVRCEFPDGFSKSRTDFGFCSLLRFKLSVPESSVPVTSRPHRINRIFCPRRWTPLSINFSLPF